MVVGKTFTEKVLDIVRGIKKGEVLSYQRVGEMAGKMRAGRAVGNIMSKNNDKNIPCHRVVRSDGKIGEYNGLRGKSKKSILEIEGVEIKNGKIIFGIDYLTPNEYVFSLKGRGQMCMS